MYAVSSEACLKALKATDNPNNPDSPDVFDRPDNCNARFALFIKLDGVGPVDNRPFTN